MVRVAVTGATGFLGSHLTERLLADGLEVSVFARDAGKAEKYEGRAREIVVADICDPEAMDRLMSGADLAVHLVSNFRSASGGPESYRHVNVGGTLNALRAARAAGVRRFVHCSTIGVHGHVRSTPADETSPYNPGDLYQETKVESERAIRREMEEPGMEIVVVRPCSIYGPGDLRMLKMFRMLTRRTFFMLGPCRENFHAVYVDDLIDGFRLAMDTPGIGGETFIIGGDRYHPLREYVALAARAVGAPPPSLRLPYDLLFGLSVVCEAVCVRLGVEPPLHPRRVRFYKNNRAFDIGKARRVLGYSPKVDLREGLRRTVEWYRENGHLPRRG